jgi:polyisoprenoid-binding protein YceI
MSKHFLAGGLLAAALALGANASAASLTYTMDPTHTDVVAQWNHFGFSNPIAHFGQVAGTIVYDADNLAASRVEVTMPLSGMTAHVAKLDEHLRSADFFDAARFPVATFKSTKVAAAGKGKLTITGNLTIKGVTRPVVLQATINDVGVHPMTKQQTAGFDAVATIKRTDFGLGLYAPNVSDEVQLRITTEAAVPKAG